MSRMKFDVVDGKEEMKGAMGVEIYHILEDADKIVLLSRNLLTEEALKDAVDVARTIAKILDDEPVQMGIVVCAIILGFIRETLFRSFSDNDDDLKDFLVRLEL